MRGHSSFLRIAGPTATLLAIPVGLAASSGISCGGASATPRGTIALAPTVLAPDGLINEIKTYELTILSGAADGGVSCNSATGVLSGDIFEIPIYGPVSNASGSGCGGGDDRCFKDVKVTQSPTPFVFAVTGYSDAARTQKIALGCATQTINGGDAEATASIAITMNAIPQAEVCGNGTLEPPETCDPPAAATDGGTVEECNSSCQTVEQLLSSGSGASGSITVSGAPGDKSNPSFLWPLAGNFLSFFTDASSGSLQISMRLLSSSLGPTSSLGLVAQTESIYLPNTPNGSFPPNPEAQNQKQPAAVTWDGNTTYVVFADDTNNSSANDDFGIRLRGIDGSLNALEANACDISDASNGESGSQTAPAVAVAGSGTSAVLFIAWQDDSGNIYGRTYTPNATGACGALGPQSLLSVGTTNSHVSVAAVQPPTDAAVVPSAPQGWIAAWQSGNSVVIRAIGPSGNPSPTNPPVSLETPGHTASSPSIASIPNESGVSRANLGSFLIAWADQAPNASATTIYAERFNNDGVNSDGANQISQSINGGGESAPFVAATPAVGGSFVVTWVDQGSAPQVRARWIAGTAGSLANATGDSSGYLHNAIDGTTGEFQVSSATGSRTRVSPTAAAGGGGAGSQPFMAFGWADNSTSGAPAGIYARRFPLPTQ